MLFFWFFLFFKGGKFLMGNDSKSLRAFIVALVIMIGLQILVSGTLFRGIRSLGKFIIEVITNV